MIDYFNEYMDCFRLIVHAFFNDFTFDEGVAVGWIILSIACFGVVIRFLFGRMN